MSERIVARSILLAKNIIHLALYSLCRLFRQQKKISILLYHSIGLNNAQSNVNPKQFEIQMEYLRKNYNVVSLDKIIYFIKEGKSLPKKPVAITFDDGYYNVYQNAYPILKKYKLPATIFITTGYVQKQMPLNQVQLSMLSWDEIKEMSDNGVTMGAHTITHPNLEQVDLETAKKEILESKQEIEANIGKKVKYFSSPFGKENKEIARLVKSIGFDYAFGQLSSRGYIQRGVNLLILNRTEIDSRVSFWMFKVKLSKAVDWYKKCEYSASKLISKFTFLSNVDRLYDTV
jgi:peptidoglycan/xylan/chitin deacetylase (PgdA/CDA1 family)